jgi:hypothetical protein
MIGQFKTEPDDLPVAAPSEDCRGPSEVCRRPSKALRVEASLVPVVDGSLAGTTRYSEAWNNRFTSRLGEHYRLAIVGGPDGLPRYVWTIG